jgi:hypothetical protein
MLPEPKAEEIANVAGREEPEEKLPTTQEGLRKRAEKRQRRKEALEGAFNLNWSVTGHEVIEKVVDQCWK